MNNIDSNVNKVVTKLRELKLTELEKIHKNMPPDVTDLEKTTVLSVLEEKRKEHDVIKSRQHDSVKAILRNNESNYKESLATAKTMSVEAFLLIVMPIFDKSVELDVRNHLYSKLIEYVGGKTSLRLKIVDGGEIICYTPTIYSFDSDTGLGIDYTGIVEEYASGREYMAEVGERFISNAIDEVGKEIDENHKYTNWSPVIAIFKDLYLVKKFNDVNKNDNVSVVKEDNTSVEDDENREQIIYGF
jgi:hypothetical protein